MKKLLLSLAIIVLLASCVGENVRRQKIQNDYPNFKYYEINSIEYIIYNDTSIYHIEILKIDGETYAKVKIK